MLGGTLPQDRLDSLPGELSAYFDEAQVRLCE